MAQDFKEKTINLNLKRAFEKPVTKRATGALFEIRQSVKKETRATDIRISNKLNELVWGRGKFNCPRHVTVKVVKAKDYVIVMLPEEKFEEKKKEAPKSAAAAKAAPAKEETKKETPKAAEKKETPKTTEKTKENKEKAKK
ncbi:MAG: hypothetical protein AABW59_00250 [archaeon]